MAYIVNVFLRSSDFSEDFANEQHNGEETAENVRHEWEDEFRINGDFSEVRVEMDSEYVLSGERANGEPFSYTIPNLTTFHFDSDDQRSVVAVTRSAIDEYVISSDRKRLDIWLNDTDDIENPIPGIYISKADFPAELRG